MSKLMDKKQALAAMALGLRLRNLNWDDPEHRGAACCYLKEGALWICHQRDEYNKGNANDTQWREPEEFLSNGCLETGWYIYEDINIKGS